MNDNNNENDIYAMKAFLEGLPKAELHVHIEGTFEPALMFEIAKRNGISLAYESVSKLADAYNFTQLQDFLDIYYQGMQVLQTEQDYYDLTRAYLVKIHAQNVRHVELFFDPQGHTERGVPFGVVINGIQRALSDARKDDGITSCVIMCFLRHLDEAAAQETLIEAQNYRYLIDGVGLDSSEKGNPPKKFSRVFAQAREQGYRIVAHAGEEGPPEYIEQALNDLKVERIDHGNTVMQAPDLIDYLVFKKMALTICPLSNLKLCVVPSLSEHPLKEMFDLGLCVTVNSDDPAYFDGYMNENFVAVETALSLGKSRWIDIVRYSFNAAFIGKARRAELMTELDQYLRLKA